MNSQIVNEYNLKNVEIMCRSNYGIIYKAISREYGEVVVKINLDKNNYYDSCKYYKFFKKMRLCKMYANNSDYNVQVLEYIAGGNLFTVSDFMKRIKLGYNYFYDWSKQLIMTNNMKRKE